MPRHKASEQNLRLRVIVVLRHLADKITLPGCGENGFSGIWIVENGSDRVLTATAGSPIVYPLHIRSSLSVFFFDQVRTRGSKDTSAIDILGHTLQVGP